MQRHSFCLYVVLVERNYEYRWIGNYIKFNGKIYESRYFCLKKMITKTIFNILKRIYKCKQKVFCTES